MTKTKPKQKQFRVIVRWNQRVDEKRPDGVSNFVDRLVVELPYDDDDSRTRDEATVLRDRLHAWARGGETLGERKYDLRAQQFVDRRHGRMIQTYAAAPGGAGFYDPDPDQSDVVRVYADARVQAL